MGAFRNPQFSGVSSIESADKVRQRADARNDWPYNHLFPPPSSTTVNQITQTPVLTPALAGTAVALAYRVPSGSRFIMTGIIQNVFGGTVNPGDFAWTVYRNPGGGSQQMPVQGLISVPIQLGSFAFGVIWEFTRPYEFEPLDLIQSFVLNNSGGVGYQLVSAFLGYRLPVVGIR